MTQLNVITCVGVEEDSYPGNILVMFPKSVKRFYHL